MLLPNLGAEEGPEWPRHTTLPRVAATIRLWRHLFGLDHRVLVPGSDSFGQPEQWPPALGPRPSPAVFEWLAETSGTSWLGDGPALASLAQAGADTKAPAPSAVSAVHDKGFAARIARAEGYEPECLRDLSTTYSPQDLADPGPWLHDLAQRLAQWPDWIGGAFTLKPRMGSSGRGRVSGRAQALEAGKLRAALPRLAHRGGAVLEPWLTRETDLSVMLHIASPGDEGNDRGNNEGNDTANDRSKAQPAITLLGAGEQRIAPSGVYLGHLGEIDSRGRVFSGGPWEESMREAAVAIATRAQQAGYWGPCGIDGFSFRGPGREPEEPRTRAPVRLRPIVEFNARFTVGIVAVGLIRRALASIKTELNLEPGERRGFLFALDTPPGWPHWRALADAAGTGALLVPLAGEGKDEKKPAQPALLFARDAATLRTALSAAPVAPG